MSNEELISVLVKLGVKITNNGGHVTQVISTSEKRVVKELSMRFNLDEAKLNDLLNQ